MYHAEVKEKSYYGGGFCPMQRSQYSSCSSSRVKLQKEDKILQLLSPEPLFLMMIIMVLYDIFPCAMLLPSRIYHNPGPFFAASNTIYHITVKQVTISLFSTDHFSSPKN